MKKKKITSLLALLLAGVMVFSSCNSSDSGKDDEGKESLGGSGEGGSFLAGDASQWAEYLSYDAPDSAPIYTKNEILGDFEFTDSNYLLEEKLIVTNETVENKKTVEPENPEDDPTEVLVSTTKTSKWYDLSNGELIATFVSVIPNITYVDTDPTIDAELPINSLVNYQFDHSGRLIHVTKSTYQLKSVADGEDPLDPAVFANYEIATQHSYYFKDGTAFLEALSEPVIIRNVVNASALAAGHYLVDCEEKDKTILLSATEIIREFGYKAEYDVPVYDEESATPTDYAYFEHVNNKYVITEETPIMLPFGDTYLTLVPGMSLRVFDQDDKDLAYYKTDCYGIAGYAVLDSGNVYICEYELLARDAAEYDAMSLEDKLAIHHKIVNISDGSVTEIERDYVATKMFNNVTRDINSFINTSFILFDNAKVKDGYILAEIQKFADGKLDTKTSYVVLDQNLEVVTELPRIIQNQFSYPTFMSEDDMIVITNTVDGKIICYSVDPASDETVLAPAIETIKNVKTLTYGYYHNYKVYDTNWKVIYDFRDDEDFSAATASIRVINRQLYFFDEIDNGGGDPMVHLYRLEMSKGTYDTTCSPNLFVNGKDIEFVNDSLIKVTLSDDSDCYYNLDNENLISESTGTHYEYSEALMRDVQFTMETTVQIVRPVDDGFLARVRTYYDQVDSVYSESGLPEFFVEYEYYIIK